MFLPIVKLPYEVLREADDPSWTIWNGELSSWLMENLGYKPAITYVSKLDWPWSDYFGLFKTKEDAILFRLTWDNG